ncbi:hypothetical protein L5C25_29250 [Pseudomonas aeruginosa]|nr:hypothetical protein [Pseudomonas aeruginosa]
MSNELTDVRCPCGAEFQADSYDAGFIAGSGMCQNCDAALPPKDICTCPSGDGSLRHPCPAHPAAEQAGGDERAAFEAWLAQAMSKKFEPEFDLAKYEDSGEYRYSPAAAYWKAWQARAALAQPSQAPDYFAHADKKLEALLNATALILESPGHDAAHYWAKCLREYDEAHAQVAQARHVPELDPLNLAPHAEAFNEAPAEALKLEQAEAEQPEIVATLFTPNEKVHDDIGFKAFAVAGDCDKDGGEFYDPEKLMTVAQHERIVKAWIERWKAYIELSAKIAAQRDAADARLHEVATACATAEQERDAALARVAELERGKVYVEARRCDECQHGGINDSATGVAACHECDWAGPEPEEDKCPGCQRENCMAAACPQCGARYVLVASEEIAAPVAQAQQLHDLDKQCRDDVARALGLRPNEERGFAWSYLLASIKSCVKAAQAQHSVPEGWMLVECGIWTQEQVDEMQRTVARFRSSEFVDDRALAMAVADAGQCKAPEISLAELLAAAPGKEVGHE